MKIFLYLDFSYLDTGLSCVKIKRQDKRESKDKTRTTYIVIQMVQISIAAMKTLLTIIETPIP